MIQPIEYKKREPLNSLTGIKSSLSNLRSVVALTYLINATTPRAISAPPTI